MKYVVFFCMILAMVFSVSTAKATQFPESVPQVSSDDVKHAADAETWDSNGMTLRSSLTGYGVLIEADNTRTGDAIGFFVDQDANAIPINLGFGYDFCWFYLRLSDSALYACQCDCPDGSMWIFLGSY